jgi:hypothetical protein
MDISLTIMRSNGVHKLSVVARPRKATRLGEYVLIECYPLDVPEDPVDDPRELLRRAWHIVGEQLDGRGRSE